MKPQQWGRRIDWHALFADYRRQAQREAVRQFEDPFSADTYRDVLRHTLPGGARMMVTDEAIVLRAEQLLFEDQGRFVPPGMARNEAVPAAFTVNGFMFLFGDDAQIERCLYYSYPDVRPYAPRISAPPSPRVPGTPLTRVWDGAYYLWVTGALHCQGLPHWAGNPDQN